MERKSSKVHLLSPLVSYKREMLFDKLSPYLYFYDKERNLTVESKVLLFR